MRYVTRVSALFISMILLIGCTSVQQIGSLGPKEFAIWKISNNDFLTANRMLIILDKDGNILAYTGGTTAGPGTVGASLASGVAVGAGVAYGSKVLGEALKGANVNVKGSVNLVDPLRRGDD